MPIGKFYIELHPIFIISIISKKNSEKINLKKLKKQLIKREFKKK